MLQHHFEKLPDASGARLDPAPFDQAVALLAATDIPALADVARLGDAEPLDTVLAEVIAGCEGFSALLSASFFSHVAPRLT